MKTTDIKGNMRGYMKNVRTSFRMSFEGLEFSNESSRCEKETNKKSFEHGKMDRFNIETGFECEECNMDIVLDMFKNVNEKIKEVVENNTERKTIEKPEKEIVENNKAEINPSLQKDMDELKKRMAQLEDKILDKMNSNYTPEWKEGKEF